MSIKTILGRLTLCVFGLSAASVTYAESVIIATPQQGVGIEVDVFDNPNSASGTPSSTSMVRFTSPAYYVPTLQSFKGKMYMFWSNNNDQKNIYFATSDEGKTGPRQKLSA